MQDAELPQPGVEATLPALETQSRPAGTSQNAAVHVAHKCSLQQQGVHLSSRDLLGEHRVIPVFSVSLFKKRLLWWLNGKESACNAGDAGLIPGLGRSPGGWHGNPL